MDAFDDVLGSAIRQVTDRVTAAPDLWSRVQQGIANPPAPRPRFRVSLATGVATVLLLGATMAFSGPRTLARGLSQWIVHVSGITYTIGHGGAGVRPVATDKSSGHTVPATVQDAGQHFSGVAGQIPAAARAAIDASGYAWHLPTWLPAGMPVHIDTHHRPPSVDVVLRNTAGATILIEETATSAHHLDILNTGAAQRVQLDGVPAVQVRTADFVAYYFHLQGVQYDVSGPVQLMNAVHRVATSMVP